MKAWRTSYLCVLTVLSGFVFGVFTPPQLAVAENTLLIGLATPLSGRGADWGRMQKEGAMLALEEINAKGGVKGMKLELQIEDDKADPKEAATVAKKLVANQKIKVVIGHLTSPTSFAAAPIYQRAKVPMLIALASNPALPKLGDYIFHNSATQLDESPAAAKYAADILKVKKVAFIYINDDWGASVKDVFPNAAKDRGIEVVATEAYTPGEIDFRNLLTKIKPKGPEALFGAFHPAEAAQLVAQAKELGVSFPIFLSGGAQTYSFIELAKEAGEGTVFITGFDPDAPDPYIQTFVKNFRSKYNNETPTIFSTYVYDSVYLIAAAVEKIKGKVTHESIRDALAGLKDIKTLSGVLSADPDGHFGPRAYVSVIVKDKTFKFYKPIQ
jgi:branched-chain amino acid transport system substrate-binding protein